MRAEHARSFVVDGATLSNWSAVQIVRETQTLSLVTLGASDSNSVPEQMVFVAHNRLRVAFGDWT